MVGKITTAWMQFKLQCATQLIMANLSQLELDMVENYLPVCDSAQMCACSSWRAPFVGWSMYDNRLNYVGWRFDVFHYRLAMHETENNANKRVLPGHWSPAIGVLLEVWVYGCAFKIAQMKCEVCRLGSHSSLATWMTKMRNALQYNQWNHFDK